jgi:hypothetical protein
MHIHLADPVMVSDVEASCLSDFKGTSMHLGSKYPTFAPLGLVLDLTQVFLTSPRSLVIAFFSSSVRSGIRLISTWKGQLVVRF